MADFYYIPKAKIGWSFEALIMGLVSGMFYRSFSNLLRKSFKSTKNERF
jgi:hypothetical protein